MARVTSGTVVAAARAAGFTGRDLTIAVAVAFAESGFKADAVSKPNRNGSRDYGLWQINSVHRPTDHDWRDPDTNAALAYRVYREAGGFRPWTVYKSGAYLLFMPQATAWVAAAGSAVGKVIDLAQKPVLGAVGAAEGVVGAAGGIGSGVLNQAGTVIEALGDQETWLRVVKVGAGVLLVGIGLYLLARPNVDLNKITAAVVTKGKTA